MKRTLTLIGIILAIALAVTAVYMKGIYNGGSGKGLTIAEAAESSKWSPTKPNEGVTKGSNLWLTVGL